jgi:large subunit ribosomal protein L10
MDKEQKAAAVAELSERLQEASSIFAIDYRGISVTGAAELRGKLSEADAAFKVVKNRLAKRAAEDAGTEGMDEWLEGPTALTLIKGDPVIAAKAIATFRRQHEVLEFKGGIMDGQPLDAEGFQAIARLPALEVLHGQLVGVTASPLTGLVRGLASMMSGLAVALGQIQEQGLVEGESEPDAQTEDETPAEVEEAPAEEEAGDASPPDEPGALEETPPEDQPPAEEPPAEEGATPEPPADTEPPTDAEGEEISEETNDENRENE